MANYKNYVLLLGVALLLLSTFAMAKGNGKEWDDDYMKWNKTDKSTVFNTTTNDDDDDSENGPERGMDERIRERFNLTNATNFTARNNMPKAYGETAELECKAKFYLNTLSKYDNGTAGLASNISSDLADLLNSTKGDGTYEEAKEALKNDIKNAVLLLQTLRKDDNQLAIGFGRGEMAGCVSGDFPENKSSELGQNGSKKNPEFKIVKKPELEKLEDKNLENRGLIGKLIQALLEFWKR